MGFLLLRMLCLGVFCLGIAAMVVAKAVIALRAGQRYRFGFLDGGVVLMGKEAPPRLMIGVAIAYAFGVSALLAWPLGLYEVLGEATSACRDVVPLEDVQRMGGADFTEVRVQELGTMCSFEVTTPEYQQLRIEVDGYARPDVPRGATEVPIDGARVWRSDDGPVRHLWLEGAPNGSMRATLSSARFDDAETSEVARRLADRRDVLARYAEAAWEPPSALGNTLRRFAPWIFVVVVVLAIAGAIVALRVRQRRAMKKVLEED